MNRQQARILFWGAFLLLVLFGLVLHFIWGESLLTQALFHLEDIMTNGSRVRETILSFGSLAPLMFMILQILQVLFAPVPGEATAQVTGVVRVVRRGTDPQVPMQRCRRGTRIRQIRSALRPAPAPLAMLLSKVIALCLRRER